ncbi:MAG TPA: helix-turn-helix domain-containing protein [Sphingobium sp.]|uniref:helix-turn-helix domain-containing protein n=1 Tax=Sphingobium sp. TaxID=1912891 RepID=UPI002ED4CBB9
MATVLESNKTKIAKRVIEVFEFFDNNSRHATVMDIVRQYGRPQSSTSELLQSLVEMGLLYKDARSRTYSPTPRLATLGSWAQPELIRDGRLFSFMDRLAQSSRHSVALFGMVGTHVQIFRWVPGAHAIGQDITCGSSDRLTNSVAGQLLISTLASDASGRVLRRLNSEAVEAEKFNYTGMQDRISQFRLQNHGTGDSGFAPDARMTAVLLPPAQGERPLALGVLYPTNSAVDAAALVATLKGGLAQCVGTGIHRHDEPQKPHSLMRAV